jgi:uncharacterized protein involved in outer membrane biogenesis
VAALLATATALALAGAFDWNSLRRPIQSYVSERIGRPFAIDGDLVVHPGWVTRIDARKVSLGNAPWGSSRLLARADRVQLYIALWPTLTGRWTIPRIELDRPVLDLERNARGAANWRLRDAARSSRRPAAIGELVVRAGTVRLREASLETDLLVEVDSAARIADDGTIPLLATGTGRYRNGRFALSARLDSPLRLLENGPGFRIDVSVQAGASHARVYGRLPLPIDPRRFELRAEFAGQDLADVYPLLGLAVPESPPYELRGWLGRDGRVMHFRSVEGRIGDSDLRGDLFVATGGDRPYARAELASDHLDFDDLAVLVGAPPATGAGETANARQQAQARERAAGTRLLPDRPYDLAKLQSIDASVQLRATDVESPKLPVESLHAHLVLDAGLVHVRSIDVGLAGGRVRGSITLDARRSPIEARADLSASGVELPRLFPRLDARSVGRVGGAARIEGRGNSVAQMLATADGEVAAMMGTGQFSNLVLELAGLDIAESMKFLLGRDREVPLRCAYVDFALEDGVARTRAMAFDTTDTVILGDGSLSLRDESLDLVLRPRPKDTSPVSLRVPLEVDGTFKDPSFRPQPGPLAARAAAAAALYAIAPPAALLALIETGPGEDVGCQAAGRTGKVPDGPEHERSRWKDPA